MKQVNNYMCVIINRRGNLDKISEGISKRVSFLTAQIKVLQKKSMISTLTYGSESLVTNKTTNHNKNC